MPRNSGIYEDQAVNTRRGYERNQFNMFEAIKSIKNVMNVQFASHFPSPENRMVNNFKRVRVLP